MADGYEIVEQAPVQDQDLLLRLNQYFDALEQRIRHGQGWMIFNAGGSRMQRIASFIQSKLISDHASVDSYLMPWRDFAINAYVSEIGLRELAPEGDGSFKSEAQRHEFELARFVSTDVSDRLRFSDIVVLVGMRPQSWHEAMFLDRTIDERYRHRLATILLTTDMPHQLESTFESVDPSGTVWHRLFERLYERNLVAL
ncbi:MAG: hypothetical protein M3Y37_03180 [Chloroflexota bacterium]|nr:hypothetical protein [Chloroflexota bacterium]